MDKWEALYVVGIDTNPNLLGQSKQRGIETHLMSGEAIIFDNQFDATFSNAALHWMKDAGFNHWFRRDTPLPTGIKDIPRLCMDR